MQVETKTKRRKNPFNKWKDLRWNLIWFAFDFWRRKMKAKKLRKIKEKRLFPIKVSNNFRIFIFFSDSGSVGHPHLLEKNTWLFLLCFENHRNYAAASSLSLCLCKYLAFFNFANSLRFDCGGEVFFYFIFIFFRSMFSCVSLVRRNSRVHKQR